MICRIHQYLLFAIVSLVLAAPCAWAETARETCLKDLATASASSSNLVIRAEHLPPATTTNVRKVTVCSINILRDDVHIQSQSNVSNPQSPLTSLGFTAVGSAPASTTAQKSGIAGQHLTSTATKAPKTFDQLSKEVTDQLEQAQHEYESFISAQTAATDQLACYTDLARRYPALLLTGAQKLSLIDELQLPSSCQKMQAPMWNANSMQTVESQITANFALNLDLITFQAGPEYTKFVGTPASDSQKSAFAMLFTNNTSALTQLQGIVSSANLATYDANVHALAIWNARAANIVSKEAVWDQSLELPCRAQWFGRTDGQIVTLQYVDLTQTTPAQQSSALFTNACLASLTVSSGIGISTVRSSTFAFVPQTDYTKTPSVTTQVIGYAADSHVVPLFVGQMNYGYFQRSVGLHVAGGAGVGSASSGTTGDFFVGNAFSFFHRALFVTPALHFTQRQELMSGYSVGLPQGSLTSVPTINAWKRGFAVTITLPVLQ